MANISTELYNIYKLLQEWTLIIEEVLTNGKYRSLAAIGLNISLFVEQKLRIKNEIKLKLRPLQVNIISCYLRLYITVVPYEDKTTKDRCFLNLINFK